MKTLDSFHIVQVTYGQERNAREPEVRIFFFNYPILQVHNVKYFFHLGYYFHGSRILTAVIDDLLRQPEFGNADKVVFAGSR